MSTPPFPQSLSARLKQLAQLHNQISAAELQVINLGEVAASFGDRWETARPRVFNTALHFLKKRLAEYDTLIPCSDGFIVIFGEAQGQAAELAGAKLADALNKFFMGDEALARCKVACKHMSLGLDQIEGLITSLQESSEQRAVQGALSSAAERSWQYQIRFRPMNDVKKNFIVTYFTEPVDQRGRPFRPDENEGSTTARRAHIDLDLAVIEAGVGALREIVGSGGRIIVGLTVHVESLADQSRRHLVLDALGNIDPELRRYLAVRLTHVPPGFPRFHLDEHIRLLHQKQIRLGLDLSTDDPNTDVFRHPCLSLFGFHLSAGAAGSFRDHGSPLVAQLRAKSRRLHEAGKRLAVIADGAANLSAIAKELDADYISSLDLWPLTPAPKALHPA